MFQHTGKTSPCPPQVIHSYLGKDIQGGPVQDRVRPRARHSLRPVALHAANCARDQRVGVCRPSPANWGLLSVPCERGAAARSLRMGDWRRVAPLPAYNSTPMAAKNSTPMAAKIFEIDQFWNQKKADFIGVVLWDNPGYPQITHLRNTTPMKPSFFARF